jgi:hypothetical protein
VSDGTRTRDRLDHNQELALDSDRRLPTVSAGGGSCSSTARTRSLPANDAFLSTMRTHRRKGPLIAGRADSSQERLVISSPAQMVDGWSTSLRRQQSRAVMTAPWFSSDSR